MFTLGRRELLSSAALAAATSSQARAATKYKRHDTTSSERKRMLASYARSIKVMLQLPPTHPHNWLRNAFVHFMDCPHGNWRFYVWHRGYVGRLEQTIRNPSHDPAFAMPFWDWSKLPQIPSGMFEGVLTPPDPAYLACARDIATFTKFLQPALKNYWNAQTKEQMADQTQRGITTFDALWEGVTSGGIPGNAAFVATARARYLTPQNPKLDTATAFDCSPGVVLGGLGPTMSYASGAENQALNFNSVRTNAHSVQPGGSTWFRYWKVCRTIIHIAILAALVHGILGGTAT